MNAMSPGFKLFTLFGTPVFAQGTFLILLLLFSSRYFQIGWDFAFIQCLAITISLLVHEFGHVFAARTNGARSAVVLGGMGAMTISNPGSDGWRGIWLSVAGPLFGFALWAILWFGFMPTGAREAGMTWDLRAVFQPWSAATYGFSGTGAHLGWFLWSQLALYNLLWGLFNLLPIFPLDGGHVVEHGLRMKMRAQQAVRLSAISSLIGCGLLLGLLYLWLGQIAIWNIMIIGFIGYMNFERLQQPQSTF